VGVGFKIFSVGVLIVSGMVCLSGKGRSRPAGVVVGSVRSFEDRKVFYLVLAGDLPGWWWFNGFGRLSILWILSGIPEVFEWLSRLSGFLFVGGFFI